jgi:hypothetical protein
MTRDDIIKAITEERERQYNMPGAEYDRLNTPSDWVAIVSHYCTSTITRKGLKCDRGEWESDLIKAAAVILAALEHSEHMQKDFK